MASIVAGLTEQTYLPKTLVRNEFQDDCNSFVSLITPKISRELFFRNCDYFASVMTATPLLTSFVLAMESQAFTFRRVPSLVTPL